jgi:hypothetical protein
VVGVFDPVGCEASADNVECITAGGVVVLTWLQYVDVSCRHCEIPLLMPPELIDISIHL